MLTEAWVDLIKNALSPSAFKDVGMAALRGLYNAKVELTDGTGDDGVDGWIELPSGRVPVQFQSGRSEAWDAKLGRDLAKHALLKASGRMFFLCAQTPESPLKKLAELEALHGVTITMIDARGIASETTNPEVLASLHRFAGLPLAERPEGAWNPALGARLAFTFFHEKSGDFRAEVARSVIAACLLRATESMPKDVLVDTALEAAGIGAGMAWAFSRELEVMTTNGDVVVDAGRVSASAELKALTETALDLQAGAARRLREDCVVALEGRVHDPERRKHAVNDVFDDLGLLLRGSLKEMLPGKSSDALVRRLNAVERRLADSLKPTGGSAAEAVRALLEVAAASPYGRALGMAELFMAMTDRESGHLALALTERPSLEVWLDTSVALPMLCGKHDRIVRDWPTSEIAVELHGALAARGIKVVVPSVYIEEMAAHLVDAARRYRPLIGADPDLARSENFYVAQFHAVAQQRGEPMTLDRFDRFLSGFGLPKKWEEEERRDYKRLRRMIEVEQELLLSRYYGVGTYRVRSTEAVTLPEEPERSEIVLKHDRCVARDLEETARGATDGLVLCSEDRWLVRVLSDKLLPAIHPAVLLDALQIVRPDGEPRGLATVRELAATFSERTITEGAAVWDMLAELRDPELANGELRERAKEFKEAWLAKATHEERPHERDWQRFKAGRAFGA